MHKTIFFFLLLIAPGLLPGQERIQVKQTFHHQISGRMYHLQKTQVLPPDIPGRQMVLDIRFSHAPTSVYEKEGANYVHFDLLESDLKSPLNITYDLLIFPYDYKTAGERNAAVALDEEDLSPFLKKEAYINPGNKKMLEVSRTIQGDTEEEIVRNIFQFVTGHMEYRRFNQQERGAVMALKQGQGDCTEYAELMVALCRAKGIPARLVYGAASGGENLRGNLLHNWAEVHFKDRGWVPFDPTFADCPFDECPTSFDRMPATYFYFSFDRSGGDTGSQYELSYRGYVHTDYDFQLERVSEKALRRAERFLQRAEPDSALACLDGVFPEGFDHFKTNLLLMEIQCAKKDLDEAMRHLQKAGKLAKTSEEKADYLLASALWHTVNGDTANAINQLAKYMNIGKAYVGKSLKVLEKGVFHPLLGNPRFAAILRTDTTDYLMMCNSLAFPGGLSLADYRLAMTGIDFPAWQDRDFADLELNLIRPLAAKLQIGNVEVEGTKPTRRYKFDRQGKLRVKQQDKERYELRYDTTGRKSSVRVYLLDESQEELHLTRYYRYGQNGNLTMITGCAGNCEAENALPLLQCNPMANNMFTIQRFDNRGQPIAEISVSHDGQRLTQMTFLLAGDTSTVNWDFDTTKTEVIKRLRTPDTTLVLESCFLDRLGRIEQVSIMFPKHLKFMYEYDKTGRITTFYLLEVQHSKPHSILYSDSYNYGKKGLPENATRYVGYYIEKPNADPKFDVRFRGNLRYVYSEIGSNWMENDTNSISN